MHQRVKYADMALTGPNLKNAEAVLASIENILSTRVGERVHNRKFGCRLEDYLFEPFSFTVGKLILAEITYAISTWEPRATIEPESTVEPDYDNRTYRVKLAISIKGLQGVHMITRNYKQKEK